MQKILQIESLEIGYVNGRDKKTVARDLNVTLHGGELVCLLGPNGAGKSTLMRTIAGGQRPLSGRVLLEDEDIHTLHPRQLAKKLSLVLTERVAAGMLTAYEIVALGRFPHTNWAGKLTEHDHKIIQDAIDKMGANELAGRILAELSDGERQKVMVARALAQEPSIMILDEVTAFLDLPRRVEIMQLLRKLAHSTNKAILLSTHDMDLALRSADRLWLLSKGGEFHHGAPEDLILKGDFERAFASEGVTFDRNVGSFQIQQEYDQKIELVGKGESALWTKRALDRQGIAIVEHASIRVEVEESPGQSVWRLQNGSKSEEYHSIYHFLAAVREMHS